MKREILTHKRERFISGCCPGHDQYPTESYNSRVSQHAFAKSRRKEHKHARSLNKKFLSDVDAIDPLIDDINNEQTLDEENQDLMQEFWDDQCQADAEAYFDQDWNKDYNQDLNDESSRYAEYDYLEDYYWYDEDTDSGWPE